MSEEFETYDNRRPQEPQNGQPAGNAYNMSQGYGYGYGTQDAGANGYQGGSTANNGAYSNVYAGTNGYPDANGNAGAYSNGYAGANGYPDANGNAGAYSNGYTGTNGYPDANGNAGAYSNGYAGTNGYPDANGNAGAYSNGYTGVNGYGAPYNNQMPYGYPGNPAPQEKKGLSIASMVLGIVGILACCIPIIGIPVNLTGLILGIVGMKKGGKGMAIAGIILCSVFLVLTITNSALGVYINTHYRDVYDFLDSLGIDYNY